MIFPQLGPQYYTEKDRPILSKMEAFYAEAITINQSFWGEADTDTRFYIGDQTLWNDLYGNLPANRRRMFTFNRIMRIINNIEGFQRRNRKSIITVPVENGDQLTADQYTKILMWLNNTEGVLDTISDAFHGSLVTGMNLLHVWMDYRQDPVSGNIRVDNCSYNSFLIDPYFRKTDLSDCNSIWKRTFLTKREAISLLPAHAEEILGLNDNDSGTGRDGKFQFMPESYNYGYKNLLTYDEFYYRDYRTQKILIDSQTGETMEWKHNNEDALKEFLRVYPQVTVSEQEIPTVKVAIVVQGKVFYDGPNPMGIDKYPFVPVFSYYSPESPYMNYRIQGVVRGLRDSQYLYNRRKAIELDILESQLTSGWVYKENALVNPADVFMTGQGKGLALKEEANMTDVQQIPAPQIPPSMLDISRILAEEMQQISGVTDTALGVDDGKTLSGYHAKLKLDAATASLQTLFDNLDHAQKLLGDLILDLVQANFTPGKVQMILEGEQPAPQFYSKAFGKYHTVVEDGLNTSTQKQMQFAQLLELRQAGVPITDQDLLEASTFQNKTKIIESMQAQQQQAMQMQQQQQEIQAQEIMARTNLANARAQADHGLAVERESRVAENQAMAIERLHEANKNDEQALLNKVKALKELESMDLQQIEKLVALSQVLNRMEQENITNVNMNNNPGQMGSGSVGIRG